MMGDHGRLHQRGDCLAPTDPRLLANPLDFIAEDHMRERAICAMLDAIASGDANLRDARQVRQFLSVELPLHLQDEEEDLFPLMKRRCEPEDEIARVIDRLEGDHEHAGSDTPAIIGIVEALIDDPSALSNADRERLASYATHARRHLIVENAIILPIARARLSDDDLQSLRLRMLQRRALRLPEGENA